ncbi:MAG TPA: hypothetical protein VMU69_20735 [Bradyrhizobium sp.]|nr:hypothetical protein [Bradyrhizobium sp.]
MCWRVSRKVSFAENEENCEIGSRRPAWLYSMLELLWQFSGDAEIAMTGGGLIAQG